jgi:hypothetical protein
MGAMSEIHIALLEKDVEIAELKHKLALETIRAEHAEAVVLIWREAAMSNHPSQGI